MKIEHNTGINSDQNVAITLDHQGGTNYRPPLAVNGAIPAYSRVAAGTQSGEGYRTVLPGGTYTPPRRRRGRINRPTPREFCPFIGIASTAIDLFSSQFFNALTGDDYGVIAHGRFLGGSTQWYSTTVSGNLGTLFNFNENSIANKTFSSIPVYAGDAAVRGSGQWLDLTGDYNEVGLGPSAAEEVFEVPAGQGQIIPVAEPLPNYTPLNEGSDPGLIFDGNWSGVGGMVPGDSWRIQVTVDDSSNGQSVVGSAVRDWDYTLAGQTRNVGYYKIERQEVTNGTRSYSDRKTTGVRILNEPQTGIVIRPWDYVTLTETNTTQIERDEAQFLTFCPDPSSDPPDTNRATGGLLHNAFAEDEFYTGVFSSGPDILTLDTPVNDAGGYLLTQQNNTTGNVDEHTIDEVLSPGGVPITVSAYIDQLEAASGWVSTTYEVDVDTTGTFVPSTEAAADLAGVTATVLTDLIDGALNEYNIQGIDTTNTPITSGLTQHKNSYLISYTSIPGYLIRDNGSGQYNVFDCDAIASTFQSEFDTSGTPPAVAFTSLDLIVGSQVLTDAPWFPRATPGKDVWAAKNANAMGLTPNNTVVYSDVGQADISISGGGGPLS